LKTNNSKGKPARKKASRGGHVTRISPRQLLTLNDSTIVIYCKATIPTIVSSKATAMGAAKVRTAEKQMGQ
jgi:hypothetical protein